MSRTGSLWRPVVGTAVDAVAVADGAAVGDGGDGGGGGGVACKTVVRRNCRRALVGTRSFPESSDRCWC